MTADVINLRRARKAKSREDRERIAAENRATFGRTKAEREHADMDRARAARVLDQARIDGEGGAGPVSDTHDRDGS